MAINQNHLFEELNGVKCAIVEKNTGAGRVDFLKKLLEANGFDLVIIPTPPPKTASQETSANPPPAAPETFTVGVTDVGFNPTNAIFGRLLRTTDGHVVTMAYWQQKEKVSYDDIPYYDSNE